MHLKHLAAAAALFVLHCTTVQAADPSVWNDITSTKKLVTCAVPEYQPYSWKDKTGQWQGFAAEMAKNVASSLHVEPVFIETSFIGNSSEQQIKRFAPNATRVALTQSDDCILALLSGRVDTYIDGTMGALGAKQKNAELGQIRVLTPQYALPSYAGVRLDSDGRFQKFLQRWSEYNRANGNITEWLTTSMDSVGINASTIPPDVQF